MAASLKSASRSNSRTEPDPGSFGGTYMHATRIALTTEESPALMQPTHDAHHRELWQQPDAFGARVTRQP